MTEPTDAEAWEMWLAQPLTGHAPKSVGSFARAVLAKWGTPPTVADEPVAWVDERAIGWLANSRSGAATITTTLGRQKSFERPMPLHATPQPTQAQAGAVPLTPEAINAMASEYPAEDFCGWSYRMGVADAEQHYGIKGGQHGAE